MRWIVLALLFSSAAWPSAAQQLGRPASLDQPVSLGAADFDWRLQRLGGDEISLAAFRGRVLVINLWASWCRPCAAEMASLEALADSLRGTDVAFLAVSPESAEAVERFVRIEELRLPTYLELEPMPDAYELAALPTTFVVDRRGELVLRHRGAANWDLPSVRAFLRRLDATPNLLATPSAK